MVENRKRPPLSETHPELITQTDADLTKVTAGSGKKLPWKCSKGHEWSAAVYSRTGGTGCPYCAGTTVLVGYNDLRTVRAELASEALFDPTTVMEFSGKKLPWKCSKGHEWNAIVSSRARGRGCPVCVNRALLRGYNDLQTTHPQLASEALFDPTTVMAGSDKSMPWKCSKGHEWNAVIFNRAKGSGCSACVNEPLTQAQVTPHVERFMGFVEKQPSGCWFRYSRARNSGYTSIQVDGKRIGAHRFSFAAFNGDVPAGMEIDHKCRDRGCVNPEHLELVTRQENLKRRDAVTPTQFTAKNLSARIMSRVTETPDGCWTWTGALVRGYGVISVGGKTRYVHRMLYEIVNGEIPENHDLDHLCRESSCVNPSHLEPVTRSENVARMLNKQPLDRCRRGHKYDVVGRTSTGSCVTCWEQTNKHRVKKYTPPKPRTPSHLCSNGHVIAEVGRYKSGGCRACQAVKDEARGQRVNATIERYCDQGHDISAVGKHGTTCQTCWDEGWCAAGHDMNQVGRTPKGACVECRKVRSRNYAESRVGSCSNGHDLAIVGVNPNNGQCRQCARDYMATRHGSTRTQADMDYACVNGHPWTDEGTRFSKRARNGQVTMEKVCRECAKQRNREYDSRKREQ